MDIILIQIVFLIITFILGISVGSFLNVVVYRYQTGATMVKDRSRCMSCGKTLTARMLVPVLSYLLQGGRCAYCKSKLSIQYPLVELAGGLLAALVLVKSGILTLNLSLESYVRLSMDLLFFWCLLAITVYDIKHKIIPDRFSVVLLGIAFIRGIGLALVAHSMFLPMVATSLGVALFFALLWLVSGGRWMGLGDAKLALGLGLFLGYPVGASIAILAFWLGTIPALVLLTMRKGITMKSEIPFAPLLALSTLILYVYPIDILQLHVIWPNLFY